MVVGDNVVGVGEVVLEPRELFSVNLVVVLDILIIVSRGTAVVHVDQGVHVGLGVDKDLAETSVEEEHATVDGLVEEGGNGHEVVLVGDDVVVHE